METKIKANGHKVIGAVTSPGTGPGKRAGHVILVDLGVRAGHVSLVDPDERVRIRTNRYVTAWAGVGDPGWSWGHYFYDFEEAKSDFAERAKRGY